MSIFSKAVDSKALSEKLVKMEAREDAVLTSIPGLEAAYAVALADGGGTKELAALNSARNEIVEIKRAFDLLDREHIELRTFEHEAHLAAAHARGDGIARTFIAQAQPLLAELSRLAEVYKLEMADAITGVRDAVNRAASAIISLETAKAPPMDATPASPRSPERHKVRCRAEDEAFLAAGGLAGFR